MLFFLLFVAFFTIIILFSSIFDSTFINRRELLLLFGIKIIAAFCLFFIYTKIYQDTSNADIFKYYNDSKILNQVKNDNPRLYLKILTGLDTQSPEAIKILSSMKHWYREWERSIYNDNHTIIRLNAIIGLVSFGNYHIHTLAFCFIGFLGIFLLTKTFFQFMNAHQKALAYCIFLLPSILIWTSGNLKEPFLFLGLGISAINLGNIFNKKTTLKNLSGVVLGLLILISIKVYIIACLIPSILLIVFLRKKKLNPYLASSCTLGLFFLMATIVHYIYPTYSIFNSLALKQRDFIGLAKAMNAGSFINISELKATPWSFLINIPEALFNAFMRPLPWDSRQPLSLIASLENIFLLFFILLSIYFRRGNLPHKTISAILIFCITLFVFIGLTTPVAGGIVRYKVPALPFLIFLCFQVIDLKKITNTFPIIKQFSK